MAVARERHSGRESGPLAVAGRADRQIGDGRRDPPGFEGELDRVDRASRVTRAHEGIHGLLGAAVLDEVLAEAQPRLARPRFVSEATVELCRGAERLAPLALQQPCRSREQYSPAARWSPRRAAFAARSTGLPALGEKTPAEVR